jgi:transcriptional regulator with XRE-family HTH domain
MNGLKEARKRAGLSQKDLADKCHVSQTVISLLETCDILPGEGLLSAINRALGMRFEDTKRGEKMTQNQRVLDFMRKHGKITQQDAMGFKCFRLSARIADLKKQGYAIVTERKGFRNEYGCGNYAEYRLVEV